MLKRLIQLEFRTLTLSLRHTWNLPTIKTWMFNDILYICSGCGLVLGLMAARLSYMADFYWRAEDDSAAVEISISAAASNSSPRHLFRSLSSLINANNATNATKISLTHSSSHPFGLVPVHACPYPKASPPTPHWIPLLLRPR